MSNQNPWKIPKATLPTTNKKNQKPKKKVSNAPVEGKKATTMEKFKEIHDKNVEKAKELIEKYDSSSEEEEILDGSDILSTVFQGYSGDNTMLNKTQSILEEFLQSGYAICLICIGSIKRKQQIWSCKNCVCFFHLLCIQRWANDSVSQQKIRSEQEQGYYNNNGEYVPKKVKAIRWCCPKCRDEYNIDEIPKSYMCFCGQIENPPYNPWLLPHSCGETCDKSLIPDCGHKCRLRCHPGPCPQCPQTTQISCKCGRSPPKAIRCFEKTWTCDLKCGKILSCGIHVCSLSCHDKCPPCSKRSKQSCQCGNQIAEKNCSDKIWQCKKICNKKLACGRHNCKLLCHSGDCGDCPLGLPRSCPCGKNKTTAPCSEVIDTCGDTCQKILSCGLHYCAQRCHKGECSSCFTIIQKKCRCGNHTKELPCSKTFTCETKCKQIKDCKKHVCNKKCCDGQCPPCDKICGKTLLCRKHKCQSVCHNGPCYPCELKSQVKCRCGNTSITVPCGRERKTRPPKCLQPCRIPNKCHHQNPHTCHMNECPTCIQKCGLENDVTKCVHPCEAKCHAAVKVPITPNPKTTSIWDWQTETFEIKNLPHPRCEVQVLVTCIGGHETIHWPCWNSKPSSCGRKCCRNLKCGNHTCHLVCHSVPDTNNLNEQEDCASCEEGCKIPRSNDCIHPCRLPCHLPPCQPCSVIIKTKCHCGLSQVFFKCSEYNKDGMTEIELTKERDKLKCCGSRCMKNYPCGHQCTSICHSGICPEPELCKKKIKIYCKCKNLKTEINCQKYRSGVISLDCDENCFNKRDTEERIKRKEEEDKRRIEEERNRLEIEQFQKKFGKKKYRERKTVEKVDESRNYMRIILYSTIFIGIVSIITIFLISGF